MSFSSAWDDIDADGTPRREGSGKQHLHWLQLPGVPSREMQPKGFGENGFGH
jgi:hypothetical protein